MKLIMAIVSSDDSREVLGSPDQGRLSGHRDQHHGRLPARRAIRRSSWAPRIRR